MDRKTYMKKFVKNLKRLPKDQMEDVVREIEQHISDAISAGEKEAAILARLGDPKVLAKAYIGDYYIQNNKILKAIPSFLFIGFSSLIIVPILGCFTISFGVGSIMVIVAGIMRTFGATGITMIWGKKDLPQIWSIPFSIPITLIFAMISVLNWKLLRKYFRHVASTHRSRFRSQ